MYQFEVTCIDESTHMINYFRAINFTDAEEILKQKGISSKPKILKYLGIIPYSLQA
jgi:hypothetical protein